MPTQNAIIAYPNHVAAGVTLSTTQPSLWANLNNLASSQISQPAVFTPSGANYTNFSALFTLGKRPVGFVALVNHLLSGTAQVRARATSEEASTNYVLYSGDPSNAAWSKSELTATVNGTRPNPSFGVSPDAPSYFLAETVVNNTHSYRQLTQMPKVVSGNVEVWTDSFILKPVGRQFYKFRVAGSLGHYCEVEIDLVNRTLGTPAYTGTGVAGVTGSVTAIDANGWVYVTLTFTLTAAVSSHSTWINVGNASGSYSYAGDVNKGLLHFGYQSEFKPAKSSYYATTSAAGTRRVGYMDEWQSYDADSLWLPVWPTIPSTYDKEGQQSEIGVSLPAEVNAYGVRVDLDDSSGASGSISIGRLFVGKQWNLAVNMLYGAGINWEDPSEISTTLSGAEYPDRRPRYRVARFSTANMSEADAMGQAFELQKRVGVTDEVYFKWSGSGDTYSYKREYMGRLRQLSAIEYVAPDANTTGWEVKELL